jgi:ferrochelatase
MARQRPPGCCWSTSAPPTRPPPQPCAAIWPSSSATRAWSRSRAWLWWPILHGIILRTRPAKSAAKYASIWTPEGSPLAVWTANARLTLLRATAGERGHRVVVRTAMRYGKPSVASVLDALRAEGATRVLVLPLYPQYAAATTASVVDAVGPGRLQARRVPELRFVNEYHDDPGYIGALAQRVRAHWAGEGRGDRLVLSFHGVPHRSLTARRPLPLRVPQDGAPAGRGAGPHEGRLLVTFQSRFGKAKWLEPYTEPTLRGAGAAGRQAGGRDVPGLRRPTASRRWKRSPGGARGLPRGGGALQLHPCLNDQPAWIATRWPTSPMRHMQGWDVAGRPAALAAQRERALAWARA